MIYKTYTLDNKFIAFDEFPDNFTGIVEYPNHRKEWFQDGYYHRLDGPAIEHANGDKEWYFKGQCHRLDGPAVEWPDGNKFWFVDGKRVTEQQCKLLYNMMKLKGLL